MTNLSDFLKVEKVRCVSIGGYSFITVGKEYDVVGVDRDSVFIVNDDESEGFYSYKHFEPVIDQVENPLQNIELTPEFEAVEPRFKVGDKVYRLLLEPKIFTILGVDSDNTAHFGESGKFGYEWWSFKNLCHATQENYERLQATFTDIEFEQPPVELKGSDLCRAMLEKGWHLVACVVSDISDSDALNHDNCCLVDEWCVNYFDSDGYRYKYAVPFDPRTGEPLTESILND